MGSMSLVHWLILAGIVVLLFGAGRLSNVMGEFAKGIKAFKSGMREDDPPPPRVEPPPPPPITRAEVPGATVGSDERVR
jgi:sec-independent protein translocase protein TatA